MGGEEREGKERRDTKKERNEMKQQNKTKKTRSRAPRHRRTKQRQKDGDETEKELKRERSWKDAAREKVGRREGSLKQMGKDRDKATCLGPQLSWAFRLQRPAACREREKPLLPHSNEFDIQSMKINSPKVREGGVYISEEVKYDYADEKIILR